MRIIPTILYYVVSPEFIVQPEVVVGRKSGSMGHQIQGVHELRQEEGVLEHLLVAEQVPESGVHVVPIE